MKKIYRNSLAGSAILVSFLAIGCGDTTETSESVVQPHVVNTFISATNEAAWSNNMQIIGAVSNGADNLTILLSGESETL